MTDLGIHGEGPFLKRFGHLYSPIEQALIRGDNPYKDDKTADRDNADMLNFLAFSRQMAKATGVAYIDKTKKAEQ